MADDFESLAEGASRGDAPSLEALLERYLPALRAFVRLRADPALRTHESDSDIVQSTCRAILQTAERFRFGGEEGFKRWLFTTAMRTLIDKHAHWRTLKRGAARVERDDEAQAEFYRAISSPSQHAMERETRERLERAFDQLTDEEREVITLARIAGLSHREIAAAMEKTEAATRVLLHRALVRLAKILEAGA